MPLLIYNKYNYKTYLFLLFLNIPLAAISDVKNPTISSDITFGTVNNAPWCYKENNKISGIEPALLKIIFDEIDISFTTRLLPERRIVQEMNSGRIDITTSSRLNNDGKILEHANNEIEPLYSYRLAAISLKKNNIHINEIEDFYKHHVGHMRVDIKLEESALPNHPNRTRFNNTGPMLKSLVSERVDVLYTSVIEATFHAKKLSIENQLRIDLLPTYIKSYIVWSEKGISSNNSKLITQFNEKLIDLKKRGKVAKILEKYVPIQYFNHYELSTNKN